MATGVDGRPLASAAKHVGLGYSSGSGFVAVLRLDQGAMTALVRNTRRKAATDRNVQVGECVYIYRIMPENVVKKIEDKLFFFSQKYF